MNDVLELWPSGKEGRGSGCQGPSVVPLPLPKERNHLITMVTPLPGTYLANMTMLIGQSQWRVSDWVSWRVQDPYCLPHGPRCVEVGAEGGDGCTCT